MLKNKGAHEEQKTMNQEEEFSKNPFGPPPKQRRLNMMTLTLSTFFCVCFLQIKKKLVLSLIFFLKQEQTRKEFWHVSLSTERKMYFYLWRKPPTLYLPGVGSQQRRAQQSTSNVSMQSRREGSLFLDRVWNITPKMNMQRSQ